MSSRKKTRENQKREKLIAGLWEDFNDPSTTPDARVRITKQIAKLELGDGPVSAADKDAAKDTSAAGKLPKAWLVPDAEGIRWSVIYAVERLAGLPVPHPEALDAWIAEQSPESQAALRASAAKLTADDPKPRLVAPSNDAERVVSTILEEPFENLTASEIQQAFLEAQRNERLREAGQEDMLDNSDDVEAESQPQQRQPEPHNQEREDEEYVLRASDDALDSVMREKLGVSREEVQRLKEANAINQSEALQQAFIQRHPEFVANERNGALMRDHVMARGHAEFTAENLEAAFSALKDVVTASATPAQPRNGRRSSSVSSRGKSAPVHPSGPSEAALYEMPLEQLRELSNEKAKSDEYSESAGWSYGGR